MIASTGILAALITPWIFYAGSAAVGVPIVIHLLAKRRFRRIRWAAMEFLLLAEKENRRRINIKELILLALRCAALVLIGLLLARPFLAPGAVAEMLGSTAAVQRIVLLDDSFSMQYTAGASSSFDTAKSAIASMIDKLAADSGRLRVTLLVSSHPDEPVAVLEQAGELAKQEFRDNLSNLTPSQQSADFASIMNSLHHRLHEDPQALNTILYVFSDFQRRDWIRSAGTPATASALADFAGWPYEEKSLSIVLVQVADMPRSNVALTDIAATQQQLVAGIDNRLGITVHNFGAELTAPMELSMFVDDAALPVTQVPAIEPGAAVDVEVTMTTASIGYQSIRAEVPADALPIDNVREVGLDVQPAIRVLLINGEPGTNARTDEVALLRTALRPEGNTYSGFAVTEAEETALDTMALGDYHLVVLANVYRINPPIVEKLESYVRAGGGLVLFMGDQVDTQRYTEQLYRNGQGLLPCEPGQIVRTANQQRPPILQPAQSAHPMMRAYAGDQNPLSSGLAFWEYVECMPDEASTSSEMNSARVIATFTDDRQHAAIVERKFGEGTVLLFTSSCDQEWNNWASSPGFVVTMLEMGHYLARPRLSVEPVAVAHPIRLRLDADTYLPQITVRPPNYPQAPEQQGRAELDASAHFLEFKWPGTALAGTYALGLSRTSGTEESVLATVVLDELESDLTAVTQDQLRRASEDIPFEWITDLAALTTDSTNSKQEYWPAVLVFVVTLLMIEQTLASWFGKT